MVVNSNTRSLIVQAIRSYPDWFTVWQVAAIAGVSKQSVHGQITRMIAIGEIESGGLMFVESNKTRLRLYRVTDRLGVATGKSSTPRIVCGSQIRNIFNEIYTVGHDEDFQDKIPSMPTMALPGSREKVEVMCRRIELGESPYHPQDNCQRIESHEHTGGRAIGEEVVLHPRGRRVMRKKKCLW